MFHFAKVRAYFWIKLRRPLHLLPGVCVLVIVEKLEEISTKDLEELEEVLEKVAEEKLDKKVEDEELRELKEDVEAYKVVSMRSQWMIMNWKWRVDLKMVMCTQWSVRISCESRSESTVKLELNWKSWMLHGDCLGLLWSQFVYVLVTTSNTLIKRVFALSEFEPD